ncbi:hypothetical protein V8G54_030546 [Vigna mungo]|uniref:Reverse transcriptase Ty1/copia-type domain-containing protein n=1 Tax=Vigna mungo TaxID=3915 RepID=A0AAQ3RNR0_VIGMU
MADHSRRRRRRSEASESSTRQHDATIEGWLSDEKDQQSFSQFWKERKVLKQKFIDLSWYTSYSFTFPNLIIEQGLQHLMELRGRYCPDLVCVFYFNLKVHDDIFHTRVKGIDIVLDNDIWITVAKVPDSQMVPNNFAQFNKIMVYESFLHNPRQHHNTRLSLVRGLKMEEQLLHDLLSIPLNWPYLLQSIMYKAKRLDAAPLPYPLLVSRIYEYKGVNVSNEHYETQGNSYVHSDDVDDQADEDDDEDIHMPDPTHVAGPSQVHEEYNLESLSRQMSRMTRLQHEMMTIQNTRREEICTHLKSLDERISGLEIHFDNNDCVVTKAKETLVCKALKCYCGDKEIIDSSLEHLRRCLEEYCPSCSDIIEVPQIAKNDNIDQVVDEKRCTRIKRPTISSDYEVYLQESNYNIRAENDPETFSQAMSSKESNLWHNAMKDEMDSMSSNQVWDLVELRNGLKPIGCRWVFKTKKDSHGNIERYKARLVAKGFTQREGIDYKETFSPVSKKDFLRIIMALVAHFDFELHQMDVKTTFLNGDLEEEKVSGSKICFLVLYVDDILLATNDNGMLYEVKQFLSKNFDMKDMGVTSYVTGIKIHRERSRGILGLSQLKRLISINQCPKNDLEQEQMKNIPYASVVGSLMYAQVCTRPHIAFAVGVLGRYRSILVLTIRKLQRKKSTFGYVFMLACGVTLTTASTMEAEFVSCFEATSHGVWLKSFISGLRILDLIVRPPKFTELMIVDPLTKGMPPKNFKDHAM